MKEAIIGDVSSSYIEVSDDGVFIAVPFSVDHLTLSEDEIEQFTNALNIRWREKHGACEA